MPKASRWPRSSIHRTGACADRPAGSGRRRRAAVFGALPAFILAESLGRVESLIEHTAIMAHASVSTEVRHALGFEDGLVRLSVGIEDVADLEQALGGLFARLSFKVGRDHSVH